MNSMSPPVLLPRSSPVQSVGNAASGSIPRLLDIEIPCPPHLSHVVASLDNQAKNYQTHLHRRQR